MPPSAENTLNNTVSSNVMGMLAGTLKSGLPLMIHG
jgi:hypothetical protein